MKSNNSFDIPILFLVFNRLDVVKISLERIRDVRPSKLYIGSDSARKYVYKERDKVINVRNYILNYIDWECDVKTLFLDNNLGCKYAVSGALEWFFSQEKMGIVIEDDVVPSSNFFIFCQEMLYKYKDDNRVGSITGRNELGQFQNYNENDYFFSNKFFCWGWASWSNRVLNNDVELANTSFVDNKIYDTLGFKESLLVDASIGLIKSKQVNSWAYPFDLSFRLKQQLCLVPAKNMVNNIGLEIDGAHSNGLCVDVAEYYEEFFPQFDQSKDIISNDNYINSLIDMRYKNILYLFIFSKVEYLGWIRRLKRKIKIYANKY